MPARRISNGKHTVPTYTRIIRHPRTSDSRLFPADLRKLQLPSDVRVQDGSREFATVLCCIYADGSYLDAAISWVKHPQDSRLRNLKDVLCNILLGVSPDGYQVAFVAEMQLWACKHYGNQSSRGMENALV